MKSIIKKGQDFEVERPSGPAVKPIRPKFFAFLDFCRHKLPAFLGYMKFLEITVT